jgi:photosystem II stability/assembly factor-like uncharacterized protein
VTPESRKEFRNKMNCSVMDLKRLYGEPIMKENKANFILIAASILGLASCSPSDAVIATSLYETESVWTVQPTFTPYPSSTLPPIVTREITSIVVPTETITPTKTATEMRKNVWSTNGPPGAENMSIDALAIDSETPTTIYAAGDPSGLFKSIDGGLNWSEINADLRFDLFNTILIDPVKPTTIFLSSFDGLFRSTNGGVTWQEITGPTEIGGRIGYLAIDTKIHTTLYGGGDGGIYKSIDSGFKWYRINTGVPSGLSINSIVIDPKTSTTLYAGGNFYTHVSQGVILKSTDGGENWKVIKSILWDDEFVSMAIDKDNPMIVYAGVWGGVLKSYNGGETWSLMKAGLTNTKVMDLVIDPSNPSILYAGTQGDGVYKTLDGGKEWIAINTGFPAGERVFSLAIDPVTPSIVYAGTDEGVFVIHQSS